MRLSGRIVVAPCIWIGGCTGVGALVIRNISEVGNRVYDFDYYTKIAGQRSVCKCWDTSLYLSSSSDSLSSFCTGNVACETNLAQTFVSLLTTNVLPTDSSSTGTVTTGSSLRNKLRVSFRIVVAPCNLMSDYIRTLALFLS